MKIEKLVEASTTMQELLDTLEEQGFSTSYIKARLSTGSDDPVDVTVTANQDVYAVRVGHPV